MEQVKPKRHRNRTIRKPQLRTSSEFDGVACTSSSALQPALSSTVISSGRRDPQVQHLLQALISYICHLQCSGDNRAKMKMFKDAFPILVKHLNLDSNLRKIKDTNLFIPIFDELFTKRPQNLMSEEIVLMGHDHRYLSNSNIQVPVHSKQFHEDFDVHGPIGQGGFGCVIKAKNKLDGQWYAIKKVPVTIELTEKVFSEARVLSKLTHPNIVKYNTAWISYEHKEYTEECFDASASSISYANGATGGNQNNFNQDESSSMDFIKFCETAKITTATSITSTEQATFLDGEKKIQSTYDCYHGEKSVLKFDSQILNVELERGMEWSQETVKNINETNIRRRKSASDPGPRNNKDKSLPLAIIPSSHASLSRHNYYANKKMALIMNIQMELCHNSLYKWLEDRNRDDDVQVCDEENKKVFKQILKAVEYIHKNGIIHRDLKPSNIFFNEDQEIKIGDFGLACECMDSPSNCYMMSDVGTHHYRSPEMHESKTYDHKTDIYSLGVILFELYAPLKTKMEADKKMTALRESKIDGELCKKWTYQMNMVKKMVSNSPSERPEAFDVLNSELFVSKNEIISKLEETLQQKRLIIRHLNRTISRCKSEIERKDMTIQNLRLYLSTYERLYGGSLFLDETSSDDE